MPPNLVRKLLYFVEAAKRVLAAAKVRKISFFALFLADTESVFGNRQDHDKHEIFVRLSKVRAVAPYLAHTILFSPFYRTPALSANIQFPIVIKPIWGLQSIGAVGIQDWITLRRFLRKRRGPHIAQPFIQEGVEIGVSYTRNPAGPPDFFGVASKEPVHPSRGWNEGLSRLPKYFYHQDVTNAVDRDSFLELCRLVAEALQTNSLRLDAFIQKEGASLRHNTLQIIEVNTGPFTVDEFLFDPQHSRDFVVEQLTRKYTYLLLWGARQSSHPDFLTIQRLISHFIYCYLVILFRHVSETRLIRNILKGPNASRTVRYLRGIIHDHL